MDQPTNKISKKIEVFMCILDGFQLKTYPGFSFSYTRKHEIKISRTNNKVLI